MGWWKADPLPAEKPSPSSIPSSTTSPTPVAPHFVSSTDTAASCPVDPKTRSLWMQAAKQNQSKVPSSIAPTQTTSQSLPANHPVLPTQVAPSQECSSDRIDQTLPPTTTSRSQSQTYAPGAKRPLSHDREVSTIPRAYPMTSNPSKIPTAIPSNSETETGASSSGNWIYPSESQFFTAVMRKQTAQDPKELATSISSIIPIHNAVNERAWMMIRAWEGDSSKPCGGPRLLKFEGKGAGAKSPRAVMKSWSGYTEPFDRHDWTVQRCDGTEVEYVIDFYQGKSQGAANGLAGAGAGAGGLNFYLDVRPKLNSFEGCRMRFEKAVGFR